MSSSRTHTGQESGNTFQQTGLSLHQAGRLPTVPFSIKLSDGRNVQITRLLRVLPGKRITGEGQLDDRRVLVKLFISWNSSHH